MTLEIPDTLHNKLIAECKRWMREDGRPSDKDYMAVAILENYLIPDPAKKKRQRAPKKQEGPVAVTKVRAAAH